MKGFFYPSSVVVIGVSEKPSNMGRMIVKNMIAKEFSGQVHAVGPTGGVILGRPIRKSVKDISFPLDLAAILTPAETIPQLVRDCGEKGIRRIVIESAGFSELSKDRRSLEDDLLSAAAEYGIRFIGPNCIGLVNTENGLSTPFVAVSTQFDTGKVSVISQSGGVALNYMDALALKAFILTRSPPSATSSMWMRPSCSIILSTRTMALRLSACIWRALKTAAN